MKYYNNLSLQQKMCRIRKKIPVLAKKRHSDDVNYEFTKIDDIYETMTPAMNKYGVNFQVVEEKPMKRDAEGNPVFLQKIDGLWHYEAQLLVEWVDVDNPDDTETAQILLIGTHEVPEKARGTALTYGLKYYFLNRFNINQGGNAEDSDNNQFQTAPEKTDGKGNVNGKEKQDGEANAVRQSVKATVASNRSGGNRRTEGVAQPSGEKSFEKKTFEKNISDRSDGKRYVEHQKGTVGQTAAAADQMVTGKTSEQKGSDYRQPTDGARKRTAQSRGASTGENADAGTGRLVENKTSAQTALSPKDAGMKENTSGLERVERKTSDEDILQPDGQLSISDTNEEDLMAEFEELTDADEIPFDDTEDLEEEFLRALQEDMEEGLEETDDGRMSVTEARKVTCVVGAFKNRPYGEVYDAGERGRNTLEWVANKYSGKDPNQKEAAMVLLDEMDRTSFQGKMAA
ncbi:MAG: ERF family protein [Lachnospiraceae bacterium]|nr:ERF family protein [Lachnospiraceae bacterium]